MAQELFKYYCKTCKTHACTYINEWVEISNTYSTFEDDSKYTEIGLERVKQYRYGSKDSELERCTLWPLRCSECHTGLGSYCFGGPYDKTQYM